MTEQAFPIQEEHQEEALTFELSGHPFDGLSFQSSPPYPVYIPWELKGIIQRSTATLEQREASLKCLRGMLGQKVFVIATKEIFNGNGQVTLLALAPSPSSADGIKAVIPAPCLKTIGAL